MFQYQAYLSLDYECMQHRGFRRKYMYMPLFALLEQMAAVKACRSMDSVACNPCKLTHACTYDRYMFNFHSQCKIDSRLPTSNRCAPHLLFARYASCTHRVVLGSFSVTFSMFWGQSIRGFKSSATAKDPGYRLTCKRSVFIRLIETLWLCTGTCTGQVSTSHMLKCGHVRANIYSWEVKQRQSLNSP